MKARFRTITFVLPKARGATLLSSAVIRAVRAREPDRPIFAVSRFPELLVGLPYLDSVFAWDDPRVFAEAIHDCEIIDLTGTLTRQPHRRSQPVHLLDLLCERAGVSNDGLGPECALSDEELRDAWKAICLPSRSDRRVTIAAATRTSTKNREWPWAAWSQLIGRTKNEIRWIHFGDRLGTPIEGMEYVSASLRQVLASLCWVDGIVSPDTLLLHAAAACRKTDSRVIVLLGSTHPATVSYPSFCNMYVDGLDCQPCGRPYSPFDVARDARGVVLLRQDGKPLKWTCEDVQCLNRISVELVEGALRERVLSLSHQSEAHEFAVLLVKSHAVRAGNLSAILRTLAAAGLSIIRHRAARLSRDVILRIYGNHRLEAFHDDLCSLVSSAPCSVCIVWGKGAGRRLADLCGHHHPDKARPGTLRARFGRTESENAVHVAASGFVKEEVTALLGEHALEGWSHFD